MYPFNTILITLSLVLMFFFNPQAQAGTEAGITELEPSPDFFSGGLSGDGSTVVGYRTVGRMATFAIRWTDGVLTDTSLGFLGGGLVSAAYDVNSNGSVVVGQSASEAFRWTESDGMSGLGFLGTGTESISLGVSSDGSVVAGYSDNGSTYEAFRWENDVMTGLGFLGTGTLSTASAVSGDGFVVVGASNNGSTSEAYRWTQSDGITGLGFLAGNTNSSAIDVNSDGSVVVGHSGDGAVNQAFRWTQSGGMSGLGFLAGGINSYASGVSSDGSVVVGHSNDGLSNTAYVWTQSSGMQLVNDWLTANGVDVAPDFALSVAIDVSADGRTILAQNVNINPTKLYIVSIGGAISMTDLERGLSEGGASSQTVNASTITVLNSAHHRPLSHRVAQGKYTAWVSGDWGYDEHGSRDGSFGLAEIALGYNFGPIQTNIGLGKTWGKQDLSNDGRTDTDSIYFLAEVLTPLHPLGHGEVWASVTALHHWSDIDTRRGYLNAGLVDTSSGDTDSRTWSIRARLDWDKAIQLAGVTVSPYVSLSYSDTKVDSYTETAGGFPADFDDIRTYSKEFQFGVNSQKQLTGQTKLISLLESVHRFDEQSTVRGSVEGVSAFDFRQDNKDDWVRAGVGVEHTSPQGKFSLMLNGTSKANTPSSWLAVSWQQTF